MADNFGLKIGVEGEKEFKKALAEINQTFKVLGSEMNLVASQFDKQDKSVEALSARNRVLNQEIDTQRQKISTLQQALENATNSFGENDRRTKQWQTQLNNAQAALNEMERELAQNERAIDELGDELEQSGNQADDFGDELKGAAKDADNASSKFDKVGSVVKGMGVAIGAAVVAAGAALAGLTKSFLDLAESTREYREDQAKLDAAFITAGFTTDQASEAYKSFYSILGEEDRSVEAVNHLAKLCSTEEELAQWTDIAAGVWATFGDSLPIEGLTEAANETAKTGQITGQLADALNWAGLSEDAFQASLDSCNSEQERAALITDTLNGLYSEAAENYKELNGDVMAAQRAQAELTDAYAELGAIAEPIMTTLKFMAADVLTAMLPFVALMGEGLQGVLEGTAGSAETFAEGLSGLVEMLLEKVSSIVPMIGQAVLASLPALLSAGVNIVVALANGIVTAMPQIASAAVTIILELTNGLLALLPQLIAAAAQMIATLALGIGEALPQLVPTIVQIIMTVVQTLIANLPLLLEGALQLVMGLAQGILNAIPVLIEALPAVIVAIVEFIVASIPQIISSLVNALINSIPQIIQAGVQLFVSLIQNLPTIIVEIVKAVPQIIAGIVNAFTSSIGQIVNVGKNIVQGLWSGIQSLAGWIWDKVSGWISSIWDGICSFFGINSPSKEMAWVGEMLVQGLAGSIQDNGKQAVSAAEKMSSDIDGVMNKLAEDMQTAIPTDYQLNANANVTGGMTGAAFTAAAGGGPLVMVQQMIVRSEDDIRRISQELYNLMQVGSRAQGRIITA